jgi:lipopolysaccharide biosynthesis glycosyltransferase
MTIPVIFACDDNYAMPCAVAITSLFANRARGSAYRVFILTDRLQNQTHQRLLSLATAPNTIDIVESGALAQSSAYRSLVEGHAYLSVAIFLRLHAAELLPSIDKAIYLDADLVVEGDLANLFNTELGDAYAAGVRALTILSLPPANRKPLVDPYFNSGLLLLNLAKMRAEGIGQQLHDSIAEHRFPCHDQDALNFVFNGNVVWLSPRYNYCTPYDAICSHREAAAFFGVPVQEWRMIRRSPSIIHFIYDKPWHYRMALRGHRWQRYFRMSPFRDTRLAWRFSLRVVATAILTHVAPNFLWPFLRRLYVRLRYPND